MRKTIDKIDEISNHLVNLNRLHGKQGVQMAKESLKFGLVGCGRIAVRHADLLSQGQVAGAELAAVCDMQASRAEEFGRKYGVPYFKNPQDMMKGVELDVVSILTPSGMHAENTLELAPYKKHIIVEKPMALSLADADNMIRACDENGIKLFVVKQNRWNAPIIHLREALNAGRLGKLNLGTVRVRWCRKQDYYDSDGWRGTWGLDGGVIANQASHHIDMLEWMMGPVESVFAKARTAFVNIEAEDTCVAVLKFRNGALGVIEATTATRPIDLEGSISILGDKGSVEVAGFAMNEMRHWNFETPLPNDDQIRQQKLKPPNVYGFGHQGYLAHVVDCIKNRKAALVDGLEGRKSLELISAMYESIETNSEVTLRFIPKLGKLGKDL